MTYEKETLRQLRISLDQEEDETSIIPILENHHKYLKEYISILMDDSTSFKDKQSVSVLFIPILIMHTNSEEKIFYEALRESANKYARTEGLRGINEHELIHELIHELKLQGAESSWSEDIDAKMYTLASLVKNHIKQEEEAAFQIAERYISEEALMNLAEEYLDHCKIYLDSTMEEPTMEVSRNDVIAFFH